MSTSNGCSNGVQAWGNSVKNNRTNNVGTGSGSQTIGQGSGSNHVSGGILWTVSPGFASPCAQGFANPCGGAPMNVGPCAGGWNGGSASGSLNNFNRQANIGCKPLVGSCSVFT
ncbi:hypothetical protein SLEP1_g40040 [Rubroshorea leprosula]|uniref:Uncharacterized protein n=1 Tax=Rubroshorea leprosula TaxID=152421 RepID=A0AAV5L303_9ROSI|nr:hypothetical protein SLEP1_g40040 [Rubroshorea leprosula]